MNPERHLRAVFIGIGLFIILVGVGIFIWSTMDLSKKQSMQDKFMMLAGEKESVKTSSKNTNMVKKSDKSTSEMSEPATVEEAVDMELDEIDEIFTEIDALTTDEDLSDLEL